MQLGMLCVTALLGRDALCNKIALRNTTKVRPNKALGSCNDRFPPKPRTPVPRRSTIRRKVRLRLAGLMHNAGLHVRFLEEPGHIKRCGCAHVCTLHAPQ
eukprot:2119857-Alexandrium_andersonii.AAC.1